MIHTGVEEPEEATTSHFIHGLNEEVQDRVDMVPYHDLQELVHQAVRAEQQFKHCQASTGRTNSSCQ